MMSEWLRAMPAPAPTLSASASATRSRLGLAFCHLQPALGVENLRLLPAPTPLRGAGRGLSPLAHEPPQPHASTCFNPKYSPTHPRLH